MDAILASLAFCQFRSIELDLSMLAARLAATLLNAPLVKSFHTRVDFPGPVQSGGTGRFFYSCPDKSECKYGKHSIGQYLHMYRDL